jgi:hypothetical protein
LLGLTKPQQSQPLQAEPHRVAHQQSAHQHGCADGPTEGDGEMMTPEKLQAASNVLFECHDGLSPDSA